MDVCPLDTARRQTALAAVWNVLRARHPELFDSAKLAQSGGITAIDTHLDQLVEMAREMTANRIEPYLARIIDDVCSRCPEQHANGYCPLRHDNSCVLFGEARIIFEVIDSALRNIGDEEYLRRHPTDGKATCKV